MKTTCRMVIIAAMGLTISALATDIKAADLNVEIKGCGEKGEVRVALYKKDDKWLGKSSASAAIMAKKTGVSVLFKGLPEGEYGLSLFVDENNNGKMDRNLIGMPVEPYAFSNDAVGNFGPPTFEQAKFKVSNENKTLSIVFK